MRFFCRFLCGCILVSSLISNARSKADSLHQETDSANIIARFNAARDGVGHLLLPVVIHKREYLFMLDTGSASVAYDVTFRSTFGKSIKKVNAKTPIANIELEAFDSPEAYLGKLSMKTSSHVLITDLSPMRAFSGCEVYGIIGMQFLKSYIVRIDFDRGEVLFLKSLTCNPGEGFHLLFHEGIPCIEAKIPGYNRKESFMIDTGGDTNFSGDIRYDLYKYLSRRRNAASITNRHKVMTLSGPIMETVFRLNDLSIGPFSHSNYIFSTSPKHYHSLLGLGYLSRYVVTFDFPHNVMYLRKGETFDLPDGNDCSGLSLARRAGETVVTNVALFSPAWWSRIRTNDVILEIERCNASQTSLYSLRRLLGIGGKKVHLVLQRDRERIEISLLLRNDSVKVPSKAEVGERGEDNN